MNHVTFTFHSTTMQYMLIFTWILSKLHWRLCLWGGVTWKVQGRCSYQYSAARAPLMMNNNANYKFSKKASEKKTKKNSQATFCSCWKSILLSSLGAKLACWQPEPVTNGKHLVQNKKYNSSKEAQNWWAAEISSSRNRKKNISLA